MIKIQGKLPRQVYVACSGGVDSMAIVDFLKRNHQVGIVFVNHNTETSRNAHKFLSEYTLKHNLEFFSYQIGIKHDNTQSLEEFWRNERYKIFHDFGAPIITCHHLNDCVETWIWSSMHGEGKIIPYNNKNVIRPFRMTSKIELINWAQRHNVSWIEDESNKNTDFMRNYIRHEMMPHVLNINPGIEKVIKKKVKNECI